MISVAQKKEDELVCPHLEDLTALLKYQNSVVALEVDQQADTARKLTTVRVLKNRYSGEVGKACELSYDLNTCRFIEDETTEPPVFNPATDF
tara:strand:+ start:308 stop:583 length:276 start_codon:yes stop_codon:yes gene_type:complete